MTEITKSIISYLHCVSLKVRLIVKTYIVLVEHDQNKENRK